MLYRVAWKCLANNNMGKNMETPEIGESVGANMLAGICAIVMLS
jgi:hypothetical protein